MIDGDFTRPRQRDTEFNAEISDRNQLTSDPMKTTRGSRVGWDSEGARGVRRITAEFGDPNYQDYRDPLVNAELTGLRADLQRMVDSKRGEEPQA